MKKILSLVLVVAMLLSVAPMTWAADQDVGTATEPKHYASLVLKDSIAINFKSTRAWLEAEGVTKAEFTMGGEVVQTIEGIPAGDSELAVFSFTKLTPAQMAEDVTLSYYAGETLVKTLTSSVLDYCTDACADADENPLLKTALVDMLNYGAAAMTYNNETVDADLQTALTTYASNATTTAPTLSNKTTLIGDAGSVVWLTAGLNLKDSVSLRFKFSAASVEGLTLKLTCNGQTWEITKFYPVEGNEGQYYAYFNGLNPAQLRDLVYGEFYLDGAAVSNKLTYSVESYAAADDGADANLTALTKTLMTYGDSVYTWAYTYLAGSDLTYIEAEDVILLTGYDTSISSSKVVVSRVEDTSASNDSYVTLGYKYIPNGTSADNSSELTTYPAHISFDVKASAGGIYYIWALVKNTDTTVAATQLCYIDGITSKTAGKWVYNQLAAQTEGTFVWKQIATCEWTEGGTYTVRLRARQQQIAIDRFMVTSSSVAPHDHVYSNEWSGDDTYHWHACAVDGCTAVVDKAEHNFGTTGVCECGKVDFYVAGSDLTYIEAEDVDLFTTADSTYANNIPVVTVADSNASGGNYIKLSQEGNAGYTTANSNDLTAYPAHVSFEVKASETGTYYIWAKVSQSGANIWSYIDGITKRTGNLNVAAGGWAYDSFGTTDGFAWVKIATCTWEAGQTYGIRLRSRQAGTILIDQFMVTSDADVTTPHEHTFSTDWSSDATNHWKACTVTGCTKVTDKGAHVYDDDTDATCNTCGYTREVHIHTYSDAWTTDDTYHWHEATCGCTDLVSDKAEHDFGDTGVCACGKVGFYVVSSGFTYLEAEDANLFEGYDTTFSSTAYPVTVVDDADASGGQGVQLGNGTSGRGAADSNSTAHPAHISFNVKATETKTYRIFVRARECNPTAGANIFLCVDGATDGTWAYYGTDNGTSSDYKWFYKDVTLNADEVYTVGFRPRDQYVVIDQFCVSSSQVTQPS